MPQLPNDTSAPKLARYAAIGMLAAALSACGGGGGSPGVTTGTGSGTPTTPGTGTGGSTAPATPAVKLTISDGSGAPITTLSGGQNGTVKATVTTAAGAAAAGAIVTFTASDTALVQFTPASGSALTDANGVAVINIKPASFTAAGAVAINASSSVGGVAATTSANIAVGAAPLVVGTLSFSQTPPASLPAFSALSLNVPVTSGGQPVNSAQGLTLSSLCAGDGLATLVPGTISNGVLSATYTNNGCLRGTDVITASIGNSSQTISVKVGAANIGTVQFTGSNVSGSSIVLKGSGGLGRVEAAQLTFKVVDEHNNGLAGVDVQFTATTTTGGLKVTPAVATTDSSGNVTAMVSSGTIPTPVRVIAQATRNGVTISGLSDALTISTGLPIQKSMSLSATTYNFEGLDYDGETTDVTVSMADQYGNLVSDGTAINFVSSGGAIGTSAQGACTTVNGACSVKFKSQAFRPQNGRVEVLAFAQGIPTFTDMNGDGQYSCTSFTAPDGSVPAVYRPLVDTCAPNAGEPFLPLGDAFLDADQNGAYNAAAGDLPFPYNHTGYTATAPSSFGVTYIRSSATFVFSGSVANLVRMKCTAGVCTDWIAADGDPSVIAGLSGASCSPQTLTFRIFDRNNNPMPANSIVAATDATKVVPGSMSPDKVPSIIRIGGTIHSVAITPEGSCADGSFSVKVTTPKGNSTVFPFKTK